MIKRLSAEFIGTFWLVLGGCGSAVLAAHFGGDGNPLGIGLLGVSLAFGLTVLTGAYALGHISGGHFNPAVSVGLFAAGRFPARDVLPYAVVQVLGAIAAAWVIQRIATGSAQVVIDLNAPGAFASNGYGALSPGGFDMASAMLCEVVLTAMFLIVILGATDGRAPAGFAPIAIGLALTLIHLISIPVTNTSVNPARSTGMALFAGSGAMSQLWLFWLAPIAGGVLGGLVHRGIKS
ncbi:aquaporin Z [Lysobacter arenosi]|uniref:Aquaporin Z n=1 Tax=Lysobacter arenosi TaxID=2795387 RepID=A0ABX7R5V3_9GAMM|nr:aquaporin Z [Lysobacter arenosi]QSX73490.1 aquaporin Z [Lysobacter arenosi]